MAKTEERCAAMDEVAEDVVNHPRHYTSGGIEVIDFIEAKELNFHLGNAIKYISRAGKKSVAAEIQDLQKARWYLEREIGRLQKLEAEALEAAQPKMSMAMTLGRV